MTNLMGKESIIEVMERSTVVNELKVKDKVWEHFHLQMVRNLLDNFIKIKGTELEC